MAQKPFIVRYTVTYRNSCLVYADSKEQAEQDALDLYGEGYFDPEDNGYAGCDVDVDASPSTPEQEEEYKYHAYDWQAICEENPALKEYLKGRNGHA